MDVQKFAAQAHGSQLRKYANEPYIEHPIRVMKICEAYNNDPAVLCAALLHDVLEDTAVKKPELHNFLLTITDSKTTARITSLVEELTDVFIKQNFPRINRRSRKEKEAARLGATSGEAQTIKYADIIDNTDVTDHDPDFAIVYLREARNLLAAMNNGNPALRTRAVDLVERCLNRLTNHPHIH